jgi:hypothetical protein
MIQYPPGGVFGIVSPTCSGISPEASVVKLPGVPTQETLLLDVLRQ